MSWFETPEERRLKLKVLQDQRNELTLALLLGGLGLFVLVMSSIAPLLTAGCLFFPAIFAWFYTRKHPAPRRYPFRVVGIVTGVELLMILLLSPLYPPYALGLPFMWKQIQFSLATWIAIGNLLAGVRQQRRLSRQLKAIAVNSQATPIDTRYRIKTYVIGVALCLLLGLMLRPFAQEKPALSLSQPAASIAQVQR